MLFAMAFLINFVIGGLSGVLFSLVPVDWQVTDSYVVVAHIHYVFLGGTITAGLAGIYYWFPKITGRMLSERIGKWNFWLFIISFNCTFFVFHLMGMLGMPRRVYTYPNLPYLGSMNMFSTLSSVIIGVSIIVFIVNVFYSLRHGEKAGNDPWDAWTLEWYTTSPPPAKNFGSVPRVRSYRPLWDLKHPDNPDWKKNNKPDKLS
jgi:heme/copper-type cytochrome/quinol oxidase subunit 1